MADRDRYLSKPEETYIGDGLFAHFDGMTLWLRAPRETIDHIVALEPEVFAALVAFVDRARR